MGESGREWELVSIGYKWVELGREGNQEGFGVIVRGWFYAFRQGYIEGSLENHWISFEILEDVRGFVVHASRGCFVVEDIIVFQIAFI